MPQNWRGGENPQLIYDPKLERVNGCGSREYVALVPMEEIRTGRQ